MDLLSSIRYGERRVGRINGETILTEWIRFKRIKKYLQAALRDVSERLAEIDQEAMMEKNRIKKANSHDNRYTNRR